MFSTRTLNVRSPPRTQPVPHKNCFRETKFVSLVKKFKPGNYPELFNLFRPSNKRIVMIIGDDLFWYRQDLTDPCEGQEGKTNSICIHKMRIVTEIENNITLFCIEYGLVSYTFPSVEIARVFVQTINAIHQSQTVTSEEQNRSFPLDVSVNLSNQAEFSNFPTFSDQFSQDASPVEEVHVPLVAEDVPYPSHMIFGFGDGAPKLSVNNEILDDESLLYLPPSSPMLSIPPKVDIVEYDAQSIHSDLSESSIGSVSSSGSGNSDITVDLDAFNDFFALEAQYMIDDAEKSEEVRHKLSNMIEAFMACDLLTTNVEEKLQEMLNVSESVQPMLEL